MRFDPDRQHRQSIRLPKYDYTRTGAYFVTICSHDRECLFGSVEHTSVQLNAVGRLVCRAWDDLPKYYPHVALDAFVVMPNHVHGILILEEVAPTPRRHGLSEVIRAFKTYSARRINSGSGSSGQPVWQRNYYERVLRDDGELTRARQYIAENPIRWDTDPERVR